MKPMYIREININLCDRKRPMYISISYYTPKRYVAGL